MAMIESIAMMKDMGLRALWLSFDQPQKIESSSTQSQSFLKTSLRNGGYAAAIGITSQNVSHLAWTPPVILTSTENIHFTSPAYPS